MVGIVTDQKAVLSFRRGAKEQTLAWRDDFVAWTKRVADTVSVEKSDVVFVGYGVQAPEFNWDDYKGVDLKGKTMVVLVGDPPVPDPSNPAELDPKMFGGQGDDLLRPLDLQVRDGAEDGRRGGAHRARDRAGRVPVRGRAGQDRRAVQPGRARQEHEPRRPSRAGSRWTRRRSCSRCAGKDFDAAKKEALTPRVQAGAARRDAPR